jgi:hypothetical protein
MEGLVERFMRDEIGAYVRSRLLAESSWRSTGEVSFMFNLFNVRLNFDAASATVEDARAPDLTETLPLGEFLATVESAATTINRKSAVDHRRDVHATALADDLASLHPHIAALRRGNEHESGLLLHIFLAELAFWLADPPPSDAAVMQSGGVGQKVIELMDAAYRVGSEYVVNAILVSFLENLLDEHSPGEATVRHALTPLLGEALRYVEAWLSGSGPKGGPPGRPDCA